LWPTPVRSRTLVDQHARFVKSEVSQRLTDDRFRVPLRIGVSRIDQVDTALDGHRDKPGGLGMVEARNFAPDSGTGTKGHGAKTKTGNAQP
jgi:hypothetical protein